jgi:predicted ATPase/DNA-binding SARP family transcriptional activator
MHAVLDGEAVPLPGGKHRRLLAALVLSDGRVCSNDALVDAIWGTSSPASARKLVQLYVSQLRAVLPQRAIHTHKAGYALATGRCWIDAVQFAQLSVDVEEALAGENPALAESIAERALALWHGPAYADVMYDEFARAGAEKLEQLRWKVIEDRVDAKLRLGRAEAVLPELLALAEDEPLRENLQRLTMLALYQAGRQSDALARYTELRRRLGENLGLEPSPPLRDLQRRILRHDPDLAAPARPMSRPRSLLPASPTRLVGRANELALLRNNLARRDARLIVLTGAGGSGKTRLALEAARAAEGSYTNGAVLVELAPLAAPSLVLPAITTAAGHLGVTADPTIDSLAQALAGREMLLVVDNAEHLREAAPVYSELVARLPQLSVLVTSRSVLHVSGELVVPIAPLPEDDAVQLFVERARAVDPAFELTTANEQDVREICRRIDGLPLAVELAAGRIPTLTPRALLQRLDTRLHLLTGGPRDLPARQRTLRETIAWSFGLLSSAERQVLASLAAFPGGASLVTAEAVCGADVDILGRLLETHLIRREDAANEERFGMFETIREFGLEVLGDHRAAVELAMAEHFAAAVEELGLNDGAERIWRPAVERLDAEIANVRVALQAAAASGSAELQLRLAGGLWRYWWARGPAGEGLAWIERALLAETGGATLARATALRGGAGLAWSRGENRRAKELAREAVSVAVTAGADWDELAAHTVLGIVANEEGDPRTARHHHERSLEIKERLGIEPVVEKLNLGVVAHKLRDYPTAIGLFRDVLAAHRKNGDPGGIGFALLNLAQAHYDLGDDSSARREFGEARTCFEQVGLRAQGALALVGLAAVEVRANRFESAARLLGQGRSELDNAGQSPAEFAGFIAATEAESRNALGNDAFESAYRAGFGRPPDSPVR